jgi:hypothetical protein
MVLTEAVPERQAGHAPGFDLRRITMISLIYAAQGRQGLPLAHLATHGQTQYPSWSRIAVALNKFV